MTNRSEKLEHPRGCTPFVIVNNDGLQYIGLHQSAEDCWRIYLGWPTRGEVIRYMDLGYRCYPAIAAWDEL